VFMDSADSYLERADSTALTRLAQNLAYFSIGGQARTPLPVVAAEALAAGVSLPGLLDLAMLRNSASRDELENSIQELLPALGLAHDEVAAFRMTSIGIARGTIDLLEGFVAITRACSERGVKDRELLVFSVLLDELTQPQSNNEVVRRRMLDFALEYGELGLASPVLIGD